MSPESSSAFQISFITLIPIFSQLIYSTHQEDEYFISWLELCEIFTGICVDTDGVIFQAEMSFMDCRLDWEARAKLGDRTAEMDGKLSSDMKSVVCVSKTPIYACMW